MATISSTSAASAGASVLSSSAASSSSSSSGTNPTSAIDWNSLIEVAVAAKLAKADSLDLKITGNDAKLAAYEQMQGLVNDMMSAAQALRAPSGISNKSVDVFQSRAAYMTGNGVVDVASAVSVTAENGADVGSFNLVVKQLAQAHKIAGAAMASKSDDLGKAGVFSIGTSPDASAEIAVTADMSLAEIAEAVNAKTGTTGIQASVIQVSAGEFRLVMSSTQTGQAISASAVSGEDVLFDIGVLGASGEIANEVQASRQAEIIVDGITVTRSTNDISDVVPGVTLHLYQATPGAGNNPPDSSITVEIGTNLAQVKAAIVAFADAYNAYRDFAYAQQQLPSNKNQETTVLFGDGTLRSANSAIGNALIGAVGGKSLALLGLTMDNKNMLVLDETKLDDALLSNPGAIQDLLAFKMTSSSPNLMLLSRGTNEPPAFKLNVQVDATGKLIGADIGGDASMFTVSGGTITGKAGTLYEGLSLVYAGKSSETIDMSFSAGIAEQLYNASKATVDSANGSLSIVMNGLKDTNADMQVKSDDIRAQTETYRVSLTRRYAQYQAAISAAESSQDYLKNLMDTWNNPS